MSVNKSQKNRHQKNNYLNIAVTILRMFFKKAKLFGIYLTPPHYSLRDCPAMLLFQTLPVLTGS